MQNWIKVRTHLHEQREVRVIAKALSVPDLHAMGMLVRLWCWCDDNTTNGYLMGLDPKDIDEIVKWPGFAEAARAAGWLTWDDEKVIVPNYTNHNGECTKQRSDAAKRQAKSRDKKP